MAAMYTVQCCVFNKTKNTYLCVEGATQPTAVEDIEEKRKKAIIIMRSAL